MKRVGGANGSHLDRFRPRDGKFERTAKNGRSSHRPIKQPSGLQSDRAKQLPKRSEHRMIPGNLDATYRLPNEHQCLIMSRGYISFNRPSNRVPKACLYQENSTQRPASNPTGLADMGDTAGRLPRFKPKTTTAAVSVTLHRFQCPRDL